MEHPALVAHGHSSPNPGSRPEAVVDLNAAILDQVGNLVIVLDRCGRIVRCNQACEELTGYAQADLRNRTLWDFLVPPEELAGVKEVFGNPRAAIYPNQHENHWVCRDGSRRLIAWRNTALTDPAGGLAYVIGTGADITETRLAECRAQLHEQRFRALIEHSRGITLLLDGNGIITYIGSFTETLFGRPRDVMLGTQAAQYVHPEDLPLRLGRGEAEIPRLIRVRHAAGSWRTCEAASDYRVDDPAIGGTPRGAMAPIRDLENQEHFGVGKIEQFGWKHLLDTFSCTECGRCDRNCPALLSGKPLSPKEVVLGIKYGLFGEADSLLAGKGSNPDGAHPLIGGRIADETLWSCTTCGWCVEACPVFIEHVPKILDMRRNLVLEESRFPAEIQPVFANLEKNGNPWQLPKKQRGAWAKDLDVPTMAEVAAAGEQIDVLYFVGCMGSYDQRNKKVAAAIVKLLKAANVKFAILAKEETCNGDPARRIGNEYLFQSLAEQNIQTLNDYGVKKVLTACAHCFNTIKNEYPQFGGTYEVVHHTEFIAELVAQGRLTLDRPVGDGTMTFHDPCYLGRYNGVFEPQRDILRGLPMANLVEMERTKRGSTCCGGGGGRSFMEERIGTRMSHTRIEQAMAVKPDTIVAACPFCTTMFEDGIKGMNVEGTLKVRDFAEVVADSLAEPELAEVIASSPS